MTDVAELLAPALLYETAQSLERVQAFNADSLIRREDLGKYAFDSAVDPAKRLIDLFRNLPTSYLHYFPDTQLESIRDAANSTYNLFLSFLNFDLASTPQSVTEAQNSLVQSLREHFQYVFNTLAPLISFATARAQDFSALEREARTAAQAAQDHAANILRNLERDKKDIELILEQVRYAAAEQGVSKQAIYFKSEADHHQSEAIIWFRRSIGVALLLGTFAIASMFLHKIPGLEVDSAYKTAQIAVSKVLIFGTIAYMLILCARNFLSHRHNEVVNRHRQNALATFTALVEATSDAASSDIVLSHAASCIFSPQETGYAKQEGQQGESVPTLQLLPRVAQQVQ